MTAQLVRLGAVIFYLFCLSTYLLLVFLFLFLYSKFYGRCHFTVDIPFFYILLFGAFHSLSLIVQPVISRITVLVIDFRIGTGKSQLRWSKQLSFRPSDSSENIPPRSRIPRLPPAGSKRTVSYNSILLSLSFSPLLSQRQADIPSPAAFAYYRKAVHRNSFCVLTA